MSIKIYQTQFTKNISDIDLIYKQHILAENLDQAKELFCKKMHIEAFPDNISIEEIPFNISYMRTYFGDGWKHETNSETDTHTVRRNVIHECANCGRNFVTIKQSDFCPDCGSYLAYEVMDL